MSESWTLLESAVLPGDFKLSTALAERTATLNVTYGTEAQQVLFKAKKAYDAAVKAEAQAKANYKAAYGKSP